jgi:hypothetical protein
MAKITELKRWLAISALLVVIGATATAMGGTIYVDATKNGDGSSWANAYKYLQDGLATAISGDEIWVAEGIYIPDRKSANPSGSGDRTATFHLKTGVGIYGGFPIGDGLWDDRDPNAYKTILSGDLNGDDVDFTNNADNSYHVIRALGTDTTTVLDGFIITAGNANGSGMDGDGGGMSNYQSSPTLVNCTFTGNFTKKRGGAIANKQSNITVANCTFTDNFADNAGGGIFNQNSDPTVVNCTFIDNSAGIYGGGVYNCSASNATLINCTFSDNSADSYGGGISNDSSSSTVTNCILWGNTAPNGPQLSVQSGGSASVSYCCLQGSLPATYKDGTSLITWGLGNIAGDPLFKSDNYHLQAGSPCIDSGDPNGDYSEQRDIDGEPRVMGQNVDIGSDEVFILLYFVDDDAPDDPGPGNPDISDPLEDGSSAHPFDSIQEAIDAGVGEETIITVLDGTYTGLGNRDIDFHGGAITLYSLNGPANCVIDCESSGRGFDFHSGETQETIVAGFTITNGQADYGGAIRCVNSSPQIANCVISDNKPDGIWTEGDGAWIIGNTQIISNNLTGNGTLQMESNTIINMHDSHIFCDLSGPGTIQANIHTKLIIGGNAVVDLYNPDDPNTNGVIECDGTLQVTDNVQIRNSHIKVSLASLEDNANISYNEITVDARVPYGQIFAGPNVTITYNNIYTDGDRYLNLEPSTYVGLFHDNRIVMTITEGVNQVRGGLCELRGKDELVSHSCEPNEFLCQVAPGTIMDCNVMTWTIERLELIEGAKLNLANRYDFQPPYDSGGGDEVLYVKELILRENSVLNTAFNRVYYETLTTEPNAVISHEPFIGFSLTNIALDDEIEFILRVMHNNVIDFDNPDHNMIHVERIEGLEPDPNGMMRMCNLVDWSTGQVVNARAKGLFAKANEDKILIQFEYLFGNSDPNVEPTELVVYLSDVPELLSHDDPDRIDHYVEVARLYPPPAGRPGSIGNGRFGVFEKTVSVADLNFIRGVRMELELVGPAGTCILINNWDPFVSCIFYCGDVTGDDSITVRDFLTVLGEYGQLSGNNNCLNGIFSDDGYVNTTDLMGADWLDYLVSEMIGSLCFNCLDEYGLPGFGVPVAPCGSGTSSASEALASRTELAHSPLTAELADIEGALLIAGKRFDTDVPDFLSDRLYGFDEQGNFISGPLAMDNDRLNGRLVRDYEGELYQLNLEEGLVRLSDQSPVIPRNQGFSFGSEPRSGGPATIYVGLQGQHEDTWGRPIMDAAFDSQGYVYITPVVVVPDSGGPYIASAKLELEPAHHIVTIYDDPPLPTDNQDPSNLHEIEVDDQGRVYTINNYYINSSDILRVYNNNGQVIKRCELQNLSIVGGSVGIYAPIGLCNSRYDSSRLYLASSASPSGQPDVVSTSLYIISKDDLIQASGDPNVQAVDINGMGHITDITEDPLTGTLWVVGFTEPEHISWLPGNLSLMPQFYQPYLAIVPYDSSTVEAVSLSDSAHNNDLGLPMSIVWTVTQEKCGGADLDASGNVDFTDLAILAQYWPDDNCAVSNDCGGADSEPDGDVDTADLAVLADHWLETGCN